MASGCAPGWGNGVSEVAVRQDRVDALIRAYRVRGHMIAKIDPLGLPRPLQAELDPEFHGLTGDDLDRKFSSRTIFGAESLTLREMLKRLRNTYCRSIGVQFMHIDDLKVKNWLQDRMESSENRLELLRSEQLRIFTKLTDATTFEDFLRRKFSTVKTFSLAGSESLIPASHPGHRPRGRARCGRDYSGYGAPRPPKRARQRHGQEPARDFSAK